MSARGRPRCRRSVRPSFPCQQRQDLTRDARLSLVPFSNMLLDRHSTLLLREYRRIFRSSDEAGGLDNVGRRYAFFLRVLKAQQPEEGVWPEDWKVMEWVVARFAEMTVYVSFACLQSGDSEPWTDDRGTNQDGSRHGPG